MASSLREVVLGQHCHSNCKAGRLSIVTGNIGSVNILICVGDVYDDVVADVGIVVASANMYDMWC